MKGHSETHGTQEQAQCTWIGAKSVIHQEIGFDAGVAAILCLAIAFNRVVEPYITAVAVLGLRHVGIPRQPSSDVNA